jgi:hypothetical protein
MHQFLVAARLVALALPVLAAPAATSAATPTAASTAATPPFPATDPFAGLRFLLGEWAAGQTGPFRGPAAQPGRRRMRIPHPEVA